jgi:hypothetical protein
MAVKVISKGSVGAMTYYVYRWENGWNKDKRLLAAFVHEGDANRFVLLANWFNETLDYWASPYGPTIQGNEDEV